MVDAEYTHQLEELAGEHNKQEPSRRIIKKLVCFCEGLILCNVSIFRVEFSGGYYCHCP